MQGSIKRVVVEKGFGFVRADDHGPDLFFHMSDLSGLAFDDRLLERRVAFDLEETAKGRRAREIKAVD